MDNEKNKKITQAELDELARKSSIAIYGSDDKLEQQSDQLKEIIKQTMVATSEKYGNRTNGRVVDYFNEINFASAFAEFKGDKVIDKEDKKNHPERAFKQYMNNQDFGSISSMLMQETGRIISYNNYKAIYTHIPECSQALDIYKDNIMSPDDFTKLIFNLKYDSKLDVDITKKIEEQLEFLRDKYELEDLADELIGETLMLGDQFVAVLSLEEELDVMLNDPVVNFNNMKTLQEQDLKIYDLSAVDIDINKSDVPKVEGLLEAFKDIIPNLTPEETGKKTKSSKAHEPQSLTEDYINQVIADLVNKNVKIGTRKEFLLERAALEAETRSTSLTDIPEEASKSKKKSKKTKDDDKPMFINGSAIRILDPSKVVELKIDNVCYGHYYVLDSNVGNIPNAGYLGGSTGREVLNPVNMGSNIISTNNTKFTPNSNVLSVQGISDSKINIISKVFLDVLSKKINKDFVRHNKEFKDFIYNLVKQDYILKKEIKIIYFPPDEVITFKVPALFRKIVFFAKLYMAMLTNILLIKMGRAHDKRVFYVDVGADANYEQAISRVIQDIKTKEFKMDSIGEINTILNLNPGRFDDYIIPTINNEKPIEIETLPGMDVDMTNDFLEFLKDSMMSGIGVPRNLIDATKELDFARTLSAQNSNFVRNVIRYQKKFTLPFTKLFRKLYQNEYKYNNDKESDTMAFVDINNIKIEFPSPASLNFTNLTDQIQVVNGNAEFIANQLILPDPTGLNDSLRLKLQSEIVKDMLPSINWEKYEELKEKVSIEKRKEDIKKPQLDPSDPNAVLGIDNGMGGQGY